MAHSTNYCISLTSVPFHGGPNLSLAFFSFFWPCFAACGILVPQSGIKPTPFKLEAQHLNPWTSREAPCPWHFYNIPHSTTSKPRHGTVFNQPSKDDPLFYRTSHFSFWRGLTFLFFFFFFFFFFFLFSFLINRIRQLSTSEIKCLWEFHGGSVVRLGLP